MAEQPTIKHDDFVSSPMGDKPISKLPGVGKVTAKNVRKAGFVKAYQIYGEFLRCKKDVGEFTKFFQSNGFGHEKYATDCFKALKEYDDTFNC